MCTHASVLVGCVFAVFTPETASFQERALLKISRLELVGELQGWL